MHPEIQALAEIHRLPSAVVLAIDALVARLVRTSSAPTLVADGLVEPPEADSNRTFGPDDCTTDEVPRATPGPLPSRYEDVGRIGVGGMGEVRRVRDRELGRTCAYKAIRADLARRPNVVGRFVEEAQIGAQLQHPNIPPIYDAGRLPDGRPWFTMKEVRGRTFAELIREAHAEEVTDAVLRRLADVLAKVCDAVGYAHGRGVVHRDLKPDNVMVGGHGEVYVLDWGLAKVVGRAARGVDGRSFPWGDTWDASWCCIRPSHPARPLPQVVGSFPVDASVYGVRGLGGNVQDWCADAFRREGPPVGDGRVTPPVRHAVEEATVARCFRGGNWFGADVVGRCTSRSRGVPGLRNEDLGFRLAYRPRQAPRRG